MPTEVEVGEPATEAGVEPSVGLRAAAVGVEDVGGEQRQVGALGSGGRAAGVPVGEVGQGLAAAFFESVQEMVGDTANAVQPELDDLAGAPAGDDDGLPHVPQAPVVRVVADGKLPQVGLVRKHPRLRQGRGYGYGACPGSDRHRGDEGAVQADSLGAAAVQRAA
ncbi:hypothetical protein [Streptomyces halstedii]|uniref:hypothetical protein n=1 Tax=Streptomyces halstedii TaxID=1944 RepID=UPI00334E71E5